MRPQSAKAKGRRLQQIVRDSILSRFPVLTQDDVRSTSMGAGGEDVQLSSQARTLFPYSIECKNQERLNLWSSLDQAKANAPPSCTPLLVLKRNNDPVRVVLPWDTFLNLVAPRGSSSSEEEEVTLSKNKGETKEKGTQERGETNRKRERGDGEGEGGDGRVGDREQDCDQKGAGPEEEEEEEEEEWVKKVRKKAEEIVSLCEGRGR